MLCFSLPAPLRRLPELQPPKTHHRRRRLACAQASIRATRKLVIGLNQYSHDTSISIADATTNEILFALSKERLTRRKHDGGDVADLLPHALNSLATDCQCSVDELTESVHIVIANNHHFRIAPFEKSLLFQQALHYVPPAYISPWNLFATRVPGVQHIATGARKIELSHHLAHAFSTVADAPFDQGLIVVMDGMGDALNDWLHGRQEEPNLSQTYFTDICIPACICQDSKHFKEFPSDLHTRPGASFREAETVYIFHRDRRNRAIVSLERLYKRWTPENLPSELTNHSFEHMFSLGAMYSRVSAIIFRDWNACGKVMGLAPYAPCADRNKQDRFFMRGHLIDGTLDMADGQLVGLQHLGQTFADTPDNPELRKYFEHLAYQVQTDLQSVVLDFITDLVEMTGFSDVILTGGVAQNSCVNGLLADCPAVRSLYVPAFPGDEGIAIGCANFGTLLSHLDGSIEGCEEYAPVRPSVRMPFFGKLYSDIDVLQTVQSFRPWVHWRTGPSVPLLARGLADGKVIAWFSGRSEFGPRALGHRSLLADARYPDVQARMNAAVKRREEFRPFAPVVLDQAAADWFSDCAYASCAFMGMTRTVVGDGIPGVVHVDGSSRVQVLVDGVGNERLSDLLKKFWRIGGPPVVLNTSFNVAGEPLVESPFDAVKGFLQNDGIDLLAFDNCVVERRGWHVTQVGLDDAVGSACRWFRSRLVQDCFGECVSVELVFVPVWRGEDAVEETACLMDGLQVEILERIHGDDDCRVGDIVNMFCDGEEDDDDDGGDDDGDDDGGDDDGDDDDVGRRPKESDIVERILDLFQKLVVYKI